MTLSHQEPIVKTLPVFEDTYCVIRSPIQKQKAMSTSIWIEASSSPGFLKPLVKDYDYHECGQLSL